MIAIRAHPRFEQYNEGLLARSHGTWLPEVALMLRRLVPLLILPLLAADDKKFELTEVDKAIFELTNKEREKEKLSALTISPLLCEVARKHSANMAKQGEMKHELNGKNPADRIKAAGYEYK